MVFCECLRFSKLVTRRKDSAVRIAVTIDSAVGEPGLDIASKQTAIASGNDHSDAAMVLCTVDLGVDRDVEKHHEKTTVI